MHQLTLAILLICTAIGSAAEPPQFFPVNAPAEMHPGTHFFFSMHAHDSDFGPVDYELISAPANARFFVGHDRGAAVAVFDCRRFDRSAIGSNYFFIVRATAAGGSMLSATQTFNLRVVEVPAIASIGFFNQRPVLVLTNLVPKQFYNLEYTSNLSLTNWHLLTRLLFVETPIQNVPDTNGLTAQRFYRLRPESYVCYTGENCP